MMRLNHINLCSSDVVALTATLTRHFAFEVVETGKVPEFVKILKAGSDFAVLAGSDGFSVVISQMDPDPDSRPAYPANFHVGIMVDESDEVYAKHKELSEAGYQPGAINANFVAMGASWTAFYCPVGDGIVVEVNSRTPMAAPTN